MAEVVQDNSTSEAFHLPGYLRAKQMLIGVYERNYCFLRSAETRPNRKL